MEATQKLTQAGIGTARLDALVLLEDVTGIDRAKLLAEPDMELSPEQVGKLEKLLNRRARHEPLAYIRGKTEFYGREFLLTPAVLEPRPESETMIDLLKELAAGSMAVPGSGHLKTKNSPAEVPGWRIADVGTGSGALGITAKLELPNSQVELLEIDPNAIKVAKTNVDKFTLNISVIKTDLLDGSNQNYDVFLCNLPYVPDYYQINTAALHEPKIAIFGGPDGLDLYRKLFDQIKKLQHHPLYILLEALPPSHQQLTEIARQASYDLIKTEDFIQLFFKPKSTA